MEPVLTQVLGFLVPVVEACGALVVVMGAARTIVRYVLNYFRRDSVDMRTLRICLGQSMVMGLEFQVAADILKTALSPEWTDILFLAALHRGLVSLVILISSLYPAFTVILARVVLDERMSRTQILGLLMAAAGVGIIAVA